MIYTELDMVMEPFGLSRLADAQDVIDKMSELINRGDRKSQKEAVTLGEAWWRGVNMERAKAAGANFHFQLALAKLLSGDRNGAMLSYLMAERQDDMTAKIRGDFVRDLALSEIRSPVFRFNKRKHRVVRDLLDKAEAAHASSEVDVAMDRFARARALAKIGSHRTAKRELEQVRDMLFKRGVPDQQHYRNVTFWLLVESIRCLQLDDAISYAQEVVDDRGELSSSRKQLAQLVLSRRDPKSWLVRRWHLGKM